MTIYTGGYFHRIFMENCVSVIFKNNLFNKKIVIKLLRTGTTFDLSQKSEVGGGE